METFGAEHFEQRVGAAGDAELAGDDPKVLGVEQCDSGHRRGDAVVDLDDAEAELDGRALRRCCSCAV